MKFTDGNWLIKEGFSVSNPVEAHSIKLDRDSITVLAPCHHIGDRGATLQGPVLTIRLSSPMPEVIRVQVYHFMGQKQVGPEFQMNCDKSFAPTLSDTDEYASLTSGNLTARVSKRDGWKLDFTNDGRRITGSGPRNMAYVRSTSGDGKTYMREQLDLGVGECVYGLGERFTAFVKNGQTVDIWNKDGGTGSEQAYKNIPFYLTNRGYGVFVNHPEKVSFEVASERVSKVGFSVPGEYLEYFIINGPTPKQVLNNYTALTGRPALPAPWSFGLWLTTSFTTSYDEDTVNSFVDGMAQRALPLHVFHFDCFWMREFEWCNFEWDDRVFPDPKGMLQRLKEKGLKICVWINPYIGQASKLFAEGMENGYLLKRPNGDVWQWDLWQPGMGIVDFTNPAACAWYADKLKSLVDMGVDCFKTDFGERIPTDVVYFDGSDPMKMHNYYTFLYNQVVFAALEEKLGKGNAVLFARSATAGSQQFPVHWGGDCSANYESMAESLRGGLSLGMCGFGFWSHDIGGFEQTATADVYKRWAAFGLLSSHSRLHGSQSYRVPWLFDEEAVDVLRHFTKLKCRLMPYLYSKAVEAVCTGVPVMRAMVLEFPADPGCEWLDRQYMLGDALLVAPVFSADGDVSYYLPNGQWTDFFSGQVLKGERWVQENHGFMSLPLMVRPNSIVPVGSEDTRPDYDYSDGVTFHVFALDDGKSASATVYTAAGVPDLTLQVSRRGTAYSIEADGRATAWSVLFRGASQVKAADNAVAEVEKLGVRVTPRYGVDTLELEIELG